MSETDRDLKVEERERLVVTTNYSGGQLDHDEEIRKAKKKKMIKWGAIIGIILAIIILIIVLCVTLIKKDKPAPPNPPTPFDVFGYKEFNPYTVESQVQQDWYIQAKLKLNPEAVQAHQAQQLQQQLQDTQNGHIYKAVSPKDIVNDNVSNKWASSAFFNVTLVDNYRARIVIADAENPIYQVSQEVFPRPVEEHEARLTQLAWDLNTDEKGAFFQMGNIYNKETTITTENRKLVVSEKFSEIGFVLPTKRIFGLGQRNSKFQLTNGTYTLFSASAEQGLQTDNGEGRFGGPHVHPFLLCQTANKDYFGIYFVSSAAQTFEVIYYSNQDKVVLNYITLGGILEMYFIVRGTAQDIISKYHAIIGYSVMPPYYALGFFQGSNAYKSQADLQAVWDGYNGVIGLGQIPLEGLIVENYNTYQNSLFTVNTTTYPTFPAFTAKLQAANQRLILGLESGLNRDDLSAALTQAQNLKCLILDPLNPTAKFIEGFQGNFTYYLDYFNVATETFFGTGLASLKALTGGFDGLVFRHNNNQNRLSGQWNIPKTAESNRRRLADETEETLGDFQPYKIDSTKGVASFHNIPFTPGFNQSGYLDNQTIGLQAFHNNTGVAGQANETEFYIHNANGHMGLKRLTNALNNTALYPDAASNKRSLVFSESTFPGSGNLGGALITDVYRSWDNLKTTLSQVLQLSMAGVSNVVTDTCGSLGPLDEELCFRWAQLATFLPMSRNYYNETYYDTASGQWKTTDPSEFYHIKNAQYQIAMGQLVQQRLKFSRYIYSQMYQVFREGGALVRPLFFDYPTDDQAFDNVDNNFMLGDALKVSPVLDQGVTGPYQSYFPAGQWFDLNNMLSTNGSNIIKIDKGGMQTLNNPITATNVHLKAGKIIPFQVADTALTTEDLLKGTKQSFYVYRDTSNHADGQILIDDGISRNSFDNYDFTSWKLRYAQKSINFWVSYGVFNYSLPDNYTIDELEQIVILDAADLNGTDFACYMGTTMTPIAIDVSYATDLSQLTLKPHAGQTIRFRDIGFIKFGDSSKEANVCNVAQTFSYYVTNETLLNNRTDGIFFLSSMGNNSKLVENLVCTMQLLDNDGTLFINITTEADYYGKLDQAKWKVPGVLDFNGYAMYAGNVTKSFSDFVTVNPSPFSYVVHQEGQADKVYYKSDPAKLYFSDYLVFDSGTFNLNPLTNYPLMGMGERSGSLFYKDEQGAIHSRWAFDNANPPDDGLPPGRNMYGVQPFYQYQSDLTQFVGVFMLNSYAMDFILDFNNGTDTRITNIMIGGTIQKFFFVGAKPDDLIIKYERLTGMPTVPPLWSFGWQQCRFGWVTDQDWIDVYNNYTSNNLPLDTMWADIDYMDDYKLFTISPTRYSKLTDYVKQIKAANLTFVPIMDAGVAARENTGYVALDEGTKADVWIKRADKSGPLTAGVWCGNAYFPDFFKASAVDYWKKMFMRLHEELDFDGVWLDENEATNFCNGYCDVSERPLDSLRDKPYYVPGWRDLEDKALGVDGVHDNGYHEYDLHNMFALKQVQATSEYLVESLALRPYVLSRSNFPGITKFGHTWIGDNWSTVEYMKLSVDGLYSYQLFGLPFMGCDICGFNGDAVADLCTKWHQLGSLYPFARNHNQNATASQEPYTARFNTPITGVAGTTTYTDLIRTALRNRYSIIRYYYSSFWNIGELGGSFFKPLFFEFPNDPTSYNDIQINILLGNALKASIQVTTLTQGLTEFYFPGPDTWCQILPYYREDKCHTGPATVNYTTNLEDYYLHLRQSYIMPFQNSSDGTVKNTKDLQNHFMDYLILPALTNVPLSTGKTTDTAAAQGYIYYDDGVSHSQATGRFDFYLKLVAPGSATFTVQATEAGNRTNQTQEMIGTIRIFQAQTVNLAGVKTANVYTRTSQTAISVPVVYDDVTKQVTVTVSTHESPATQVNVYDVIRIEILTP